MSDGNLLHLTDKPSAHGKNLSSELTIGKLFEENIEEPANSLFVDKKRVYEKLITELTHHPKSGVFARLLKAVLLIHSTFRKDPRDRIPETFFRNVIEIDPETDLTMEEIRDVRKESHPEHFVIGGHVNQDSKTITLYRGDFSRFVLPFDWFKKNPLSEPQFSKFKVVDGGMSIRLGEYEVSVASILYEQYSDYRRHINVQRKREDQTFGAHLFRARHILKLTQNDFPGIRRETILRIENQKTNRVHQATKEKILKALNMTEKELLTY